MKQYKNYMFDLYGTLVDIHTDEENVLLWQRLCIYLGMQGISVTPETLREKFVREVTQREAQAKIHHGPGAEIDIGPVFASFYKESGIIPQEQDIARLAQLFRILSLERLQLFPGAKTVLETLRKRGKGVYLLSNAQALFTLPELRALKLEQHFDGIIISSCEGLKKPDSRLYQLALERYGLDPDDTVMVGNDDRADCWGAFDAGLESMYIFTDQSPRQTGPLPENCRVLQSISDIL